MPKTIPESQSAIDRRPKGALTESRAEITAGMPVDESRSGPVASQKTVQDWWWCFAVGIGFAIWAMRTVGAYAIVQTDAARHAMNGVFLRDLIARGKFTDVLPFARSYFAHLPALSMPYHPPLFPAVEAIFYFIFGVNAFTARLVVAIAVGLSAILLFQLVKATHGSTLVATLATVTFFCLPQSMWLGSEVMLEFPTLVLTLLAIRCLQPVDTEYSIWRGLIFAVLAGAAVWTKQQAVFLGLVPFLYIAFIRRWRLFLKPAIWISSVVFGAFVIGLSALSVPFEGAGINQGVPAVADHMYLRYMRLFWRNLTFYSGHYTEFAGVVGLILVGAIVTACVLGLFRRRPAGLYASWAIASLLVLFLLRPFSTRYLFLTCPAMLVLGYVGLMRVVARVTRSHRWAAVAAVSVALLGIFWGFPYRTFFLHGPDEAARWLAGIKPKRILYCGETDGNFIFSYRSAQPALTTAVISADKLRPTVFTPAGMEQFAHDYGVEYVVVEDTTGSEPKRIWTNLMDHPAPSMVIARDIKVSSSTERWNGQLRVYRFTDPSPSPKDTLSMRMLMIGTTMNFQLGN